VRTIGVKLEAETASFTRKMRDAGKTTVQFGGELDKASKAGKLDKVTHQATLLGAGLLGVAGVAVKMAADFDKQMSAVAAATHAPTAEMDLLRKAAIKAGKDTQYSATEAGKGIEELSKAGVSTAAILGGGLKGALDLAAAGQISVGDAAETAASAMTQFKLQGKDLPHVADLLAAGAGKAQGSVADMSAALNQAGLIASQTGLSIEDTTGTLAAFASAGLTGSDAGTSFKTMLQALQAPSAKTKDLMDELGISAYDTQGGFIGIAALAGQLKDKLGGLTQAERAHALAQIFGSDATRAASVLYQQGAAGIQTWIDKTNDSGYAAETARIKTDNLAGDLERLKGSLETVAIQAGSGANGGLRSLTQALNGLVNGFADLPGWMQQSVVWLTALSGAGLLGASGLLKARKTVNDFIGELTKMGPAGASAVSTLGGIGKVAGTLGVAGLGVGLVFEGFKAFGDWVEKKHAPVKADIDALTTSIKDFAATGQATGELAGHYGAQLQKIGQDVSSVTKGMADLAQAQADYAAGLTAAEATANWNPVDPQAVQDIKDLDTALAGLVKSGGANQAKIFLDQLAASGALTAAQFKTLTGMLPNYAAATQSAAVANTGLAKGFGSTEANAKTMTSALDAAIQAGQTLTDVWNQLHGAMLSSDQAALAAKTTIDAVKKSFKDNGAAIEGNSRKALENRVAVELAAQAAAKAAQAKYEETGSVKAASKTYDVYIGDLRKTLSQSGLTKTQVDKLIAAYTKMPSDVPTKISQPGMPDAQAKTKTLWDKLKGVDGNWVAHISTTGYSKVAGDLRHLLAAQQALKDSTSVNEANRELGHFFADGGYTGPGPRTQVAGFVHRDEQVIKAPSRQKFESAHPGALDHINRTGELPGYAGGGYVDMPFPTTTSKTKIPQMSFPGPGGGMTYKWIEAVVRAAFPGMRVLSDYRPGARTLSGNRSYHAVGRAVDFPASQPLAEWVNLHYKARTKEFISPWNSLNIHNGARHSYTGAIYRQHSGPNAHDHWAMNNGGTISEPIFGVGASGRTYSFGENYQRERVIPERHMSGGGGATVVNNVNLHVALAAGANMREAGRQIAEQLGSYLTGGGSLVVRGEQKL
jgi:TP901 family phage tail tape measure protein